MAYSWDNDHDYNYDSTGKGFSFVDAKKSYLDDDTSKKTDKKIPDKSKERSYVTAAKAIGAEKAVYTYKTPFPKTDSPYPIIIGIDTTGSMETWPQVFYNKLPLLFKEAAKYFPGCEISFQAINDYYSDGEDAAFQPAPFGKGVVLDTYISELYPVGGGGGKQTESYEIFAAYNSFLKAPHAKIKPLAIILGDEIPFDQVPLKIAQYYKLASPDTVESIMTKEVFQKLHSICDVYLIRKPYYGIGKDDVITNVWKDIACMPDEKIINIEDPVRVVDTIIGILGIITGNSAGFEEELITRQTEVQAKEVLAALKNLKSAYESGLTQHSQSTGLGDPGSIKTKGLKIDE